MKKLIEELEAAIEIEFHSENYTHGIGTGLNMAIEIVKSHDPFILISEKLPPEHEKVLVQYGDDSVLLGIMDSENKWSLFWSDGQNKEDPSRPVVKWAYLPEVKL